MNLVQWLHRLFRNQKVAPANPEKDLTNTSSSRMVRFYDVPSQKVIQIPEDELAEGAVQAQVDGIEGTVWLAIDQLQPGPLQHPPFEEEILEYIRQIQSTFREHRDITLDEWEDGFRRDIEPAREIALWSHAAAIYQEFAEAEPSLERRQDIYKCILCCMNASPESVWKILGNTAMNQNELEPIVRSFYGQND